ncbi:pilus assembly protein TadG-related protein [Agromyces archimandritae]|uniref:Putative Flp pilus-assembly TadG-like N-terminal domain-containing protein n=1 Tax=Agromyces archimandritae TaxID=2781962 RepID=A0A975FLW2_9MICO|nr:pilus assembly protein TadG-related protein [Agromyces archimandritae]QTX04319.1 hypothetical protein G127AT_13725 [Agromyces archimandritae]
MSARETVARARDDERGSTLLLALGYGVLALAVILVIVSATSLYVERKRLFTLADGAALAAAESFGTSNMGMIDGELVIGLDGGSVRAVAADYLGIAEHGLHEVRIVAAEPAVDGGARVTLSAVWVAPLSTELVPITVPIQVTASAEAFFR